MKKDPKLGNAFLDLALAGVVLTTIAIVVDALRGDGIELGWIGAAFLTYSAYIVGAVRVGASPLDYLRHVGKRGSLPR